jgi:hypothetical protein
MSGSDCVTLRGWPVCSGGFLAIAEARDSPTKHSDKGAPWGRSRPAKHAPGREFSLSNISGNMLTTIDSYLLSLYWIDYPSV